jgi:DNA mismatch repair protein MutL
MPSILGDINIVKLINDLADHLLALGENIALTELIEHVTETYACHYSIRAGRVLSTLEMNELLRQMESTPFSAQCNHGRPTYVELKLKDIEKLFGRK